jgi:cytoskeletal protein RodZ
MEETLDQIGIQLKSAREAAGLSIDDVIFQTQLPKKVIIALENEDFSTFSSSLYAKSFLAQYSEFLRVDAQSWLDQIEPSSFVAGDLFDELVRGNEAVPSPCPSAQPRGGLFSIIGLLAVSTGLVTLAIKGHNAFENRFGKESQPASSIPPAPAATLPIISHSPQQQTPIYEKEDEALAQPPPRAIIVR